MSVLGVQAEATEAELSEVGDVKPRVQGRVGWRSQASLQVE